MAAFTGELGTAYSSPGSLVPGAIASVGAMMAAASSSKPEVRFGPPMPHAPWAQRPYIEPKYYLRPALIPSGPPGVTPDIQGKPLLERVPDIKGPHGLNRLRRHTDQLSIILNSLVVQGILVQTG